MDYVQKAIAGHFRGWLAAVIITVLGIVIFILAEVVKNAVKHRYDKKLEEHKAKLNHDKDVAKLRVYAKMTMQHSARREVLISVEVINTGKRPCFVKSVSAVLQPSVRAIPGSSLPPLVDSPEELDNLLLAPQKGVVEIKPDGASSKWEFYLNANPHLRTYVGDGEPRGKGFVELTSGDRVEYSFLMLPDEAWGFLTAPIAPVFDGRAGHRCSRCGFTFLKQANAVSVVCPQCKQMDALRPEQFPAPAGLANTTRKGHPFFSFGPEETILDDLTFHVLKAYSNFPSQHAAMGVTMVSQYCRITHEEALAAIKHLHGMKYISTLIPAPGEWNGQYQITALGRDYVRRHAT